VSATVRENAALIATKSTTATSQGTPWMTLMRSGAASTARRAARR
jgi:hypothetical protein